MCGDAFSHACRINGAQFQNWISVSGFWTRFLAHFLNSSLTRLCFGCFWFSIDLFFPPNKKQNRSSSCIIRQTVMYAHAEARSDGYKHGFWWFSPILKDVGLKHQTWFSKALQEVLNSLSDSFIQFRCSNDQQKHYVISQKWNFFLWFAPNWEWFWCVDSCWS